MTLEKPPGDGMEAAERPAGRGEARLSTQRLDDLEGAELAGAWNRLADAAAPGSPYLTWEWMATYWRVRRGGPGAPQLHALLVRRDGELVGVAPLYSAQERLGGVLPVRVLRLLGTGWPHVPTDLDLLAAPQDAAAVGRAVAEQLRAAQSSWDLLDLWPVASGAPGAAALARALQHGGLAVSDEPAHESRHAPLPPSFEAYLEQISQGYGKKLARYERKLQRERPYRVVVCDDEARIAADFAELVSMRLSSWQRPEPHAFSDGPFVDFHERVLPQLLRRGWVRLVFLEALDGERLAGGYLLLRDGVATFYQQARQPGLDKLHVGSVLIWHLLQLAIAEGARRFDFGPDAMYKTHFAADTRQDRRLRVYAPSAAGRLQRTYDAARALARRHLRAEDEPPPRGG